MILLLALLAEAPRFDPMEIEDVERIGAVLLRRVARIEVVPEKKDKLLDDGRREGFAAALDADHLAVMSFVVEDAKTIRVFGSRGRSTTAVAVRTDKQRRVAILRTAAKLKTIWLEPSDLATAKSMKQGRTVFALISTASPGQVVYGEVTDDGAQPETEGFPRTSLKLAGGMPIFDDRARLLGVARTVAWDKDPYYIVPFTKILEVRTGSVAASQAKKKKPTTAGDGSWETIEGEEDPEE